MRIRLLAALIAVAGVATVAAAQGAGPGPRGGRRLYDPSTVTTVSGQVMNVERFQHGRGEGVHAIVKTSDGDLKVLLGPSWYLDQQAVKVGTGDAIEVTGSKVQLASGPALLAQVIKKGDQSLTLRSADGVPVWAGPRASGGPGPCGGAGHCGGGCPCQRDPGAQGGFGGR